MSDIISGLAIFLFLLAVIALLIVVEIIEVVKNFNSNLNK